MDFTESLSRQSAKESRQRLTTAGERVREVNLNLRNTLQAAARYSDPDLTTEGLRKRQEQMATTARDAAGRRLSEVRDEVERDVSRVRAWATPKRPRVGDDAVSLMKLQIAWDRARMLLESGRTMIQVLKQADADMALALREWGPDWLRAQAPQPQGLSRLSDDDVPGVSGLVRSADDRLREVLGGETADALGALRDVDVLEASLAPEVQFIERQVAGVDDSPLALMASGLASRDAERQAGSGWSEPTEIDSTAEAS